MDIFDKIHWLGQATVKLNNDQINIYFDPYMITETDRADLIFITHKHYDHFSMEDLAKVATTATKFVAPENCVEELQKAGYSNITSVSPGKKYEVGGIKFETVPAYNVVKENYHNKSNNWVGYIVDFEGWRIYHAGDTERIPEMKNVSCDIAMLPLGQVYTMNNVQEAAQAAMDVKAKFAIPIHWGLYEGTEEDALKFKQLLEGKVEVVLK